MDIENKIRVIIADGHPVFRNGLRNIINGDKGIEILGEADNGKSAFEIILDLKPDIALLNIEMSEMSGIEILKEIRNRNLDIKTIFFTIRSDEASFDEAMNLGINGYILKDCAICDVLGCIRNVADGQYCITPALSNTLLLRRNKIKNLESEFSFLDKLTKSEKSILYLLAEGKTSKQIGEELFISHKTVDNHKSNISDKLGLKGLHTLLKFAIENREVLLK